MNLRKFILTAAIIGMAGPLTSQAAIVYVSETAADITLSTYSTGYGGQDGSVGNPFGTIQLAYRYLWTQAGTHEIRLIGDGDGIFHDGEVGTSSGASPTANGTLRFESGGGIFPTGTVPFGSITLKANDPVNDPVTIWFSKDQASNADISTATNPAFPDRGSNGSAQGLISPGTLYDDLNLNFENLTFELDGGTYLIASQSQGTGANNWTFDFTNVNVLLKTDNVNDTSTPLADNFGRAGLYFTTQNGSQGGIPDIRAETVDFYNSNIYYDPVGRIGNNGLMAAHGYGSTDIFRISTFFDGNNSSRLWTWTTDTALTSATIHNNLNDNIFAGIYNLQNPPAGFTGGGNYHQINENGTYLSPGSGTAPMFLNYFLTTLEVLDAVPEPSTVLLWVTGAGVLAWYRRRRRA